MKSLDESDRAKLRSSQILTSLHQIVSELVQNALDADASHVDVGVDPAQWACWVRDDGIGIGRDALKSMGKGAEGRYRTSKQYTASGLTETNTFGFRGEALASAADLCCLEISSRDASAKESWSVISKGGQQIYFGPAVRWRREKPGTTVYVRDAFFNLPVRRRSHPNGQRTLDLVRKEIERYALVSPHVAFTLEKTNKNRDGSTGQSRIMTIVKSSSSLAAFHNIFGRSFAERVDEIIVTRGQNRVEGFISLDGASSKAYQFLYVNRFPLDYCELHRTIDLLFVNSAFSKQEVDAPGSDDPAETRRSPRKVEYKPVYCLNLQLPRDSVDVFLEPSKRSMHFQDARAVDGILTVAVQSFLERNGFVVPSSSSAPTVHSEGRVELNDHISSPIPRKRLKIHTNDDAERLINRHSDVILAPRAHNDLHARPDASDTHSLAWKDPSTGEMFLVDARTGNSIPDTKPSHPGASGISGRIGRSSYVDRGQLKLKDEAVVSQASDAKSPAWIQSTLEKCKSAVFQPGEASVRLIAPRTCDGHAETSSSSALSVFQSNHLTTGTKQRFSKEDLQSIRVLGQVDHKFIACVVTTEAGNDCVVVIDQHAADERVRVERFLKELCSAFLGDGPGVKREALPEPIPVLLPLTLVQRIATSESFGKFLSRWGFEVVVRSDGDVLGELQQLPANEKGQVLVTTVPSMMFSRLSKPTELAHTFESCASMLEDDFELSSLEHEIEEVNGEEALWTRALKKFPAALLDLINSKACRGAVMFNDPLSLEQCEALVTSLSQTVFPFQCAHGRPSMIPLTGLKKFTVSSQITTDWTKLASNTTAQ